MVRKIGGHFFDCAMTDRFDRISFLYQAGELMESKGATPIAQYYVSQMRKIASKSVLRM
jgi:RNase P subunit RPR2